MNGFIVWAGRDTGSVWFPITPGQEVRFEQDGLSPGIYTIRAWAEDRGGIGCDTTIVDTLKSRLAKPGLARR
jgi:hypothetical protein